jgi:hypothetical protein
MSSSVEHWITRGLYFTVSIVINERLAHYMAKNIADEIRCIYHITYLTLTDRATNVLYEKGL